MGADPAQRSAEVRALRLGMDLGMTLIDTAEMYASGGAEEVVGEALSGRRGEAYVVSKVVPDNASHAGTREACERSLRRMKIEVIDLYLLHWTPSHPLEETLRAFVELKREGKIRSYGVSNFDTAAMAAALELAGGEGIASNQILYNLEKRGPEQSLIPWCEDNNVFVMAYSPVAEGGLRQPETLAAVAARHDVSPYAAAIAWSLRLPGVMSIPKAVREDHVRDNAKAAEVAFTEQDLADLDRAFPPPHGEAPLSTA